MVLYAALFGGVEAAAWLSWRAFAVVRGVDSGRDLVPSIPARGQETMLRLWGVCQVGRALLRQQAGASQAGGGR